MIDKSFKKYLLVLITSVNIQSDIEIKYVE